MLEPASLAHGLVERLLERGPVFRVYPVQECRVGRPRRRRIETEDAEVFCRPGDLAGADVPAPAAGAADLLRLGERGLASPQVFLGTLALGQIEHEGDPPFATFLERRQPPISTGTRLPSFPEVSLLERWQ